MKNNYDGKYHDIKKILSDINHEITSIIYCSIDHR